jgi:hypothetical protein
MIDFLVSHLHESLATNEPSIADCSEYIVRLHLDPNHYSMPILVHEPEWYLDRLLNKDYAKINNALKFEPTKTMHGIIRVLVRTHLNRQGIGQVVRGSGDKTLTPRILKAFEDNFDYQSLATVEGFSDIWQTMLSNYPELYDNIDRDSILALSRLGENALSSAKDATKQGVHDNWAKVLTGIFSGIRFLKTYNFNADKLWEEMSRQRPQDMIAIVKNNIHQFGTALAGSFLADLGHSGYIKADTHIIDSVKTLLNQESVSDLMSIKKMYEMSKELDMPPRMLDKIFYLGCSGNFYLIGLKVDNKNQFKSSFLHKLKELCI